MNWKLPTTETEWEECLSAYIDGELDVDAASALEAHLEHDPKHAHQVEVLRGTSAILQSWTVDAPDPRAELRASLGERRASSSANVWSKRILVRHRGALRIAAAFAMGVLAGGWMMSPTRPTASKLPPARTVQQSPPATAASAVSPDRANAVFKEVEAAALTQRIQQDARGGRWKNAVEGLERMHAQYAGTEAANTFAKDPMARRIFRRSFRGRS